jgi:ADP-ribose pyrophosphatase
MTAPETVSSREIYAGKIFDVHIDRVREDTVEYDREIVVHKGSAVILPVYDDGTIALVRQYRHAAGKFMLEVPAGSLNAGENPIAGAIRELEEEIGASADRLELLAEFYVSPGFVTEKMYLYRATGLTEVGQKLEPDELITIERLTFDRALEMVRTGEIEDAKTIIAVTLGKGDG